MGTRAWQTLLEQPGSLGYVQRCREQCQLGQGAKHGCGSSASGINADEEWDLGRS